MSNILVTGANGQVGLELLKLSYGYDATFFFTNRDALDITHKEALYEFVLTHDINIIINTAAYTAVDKAEKEIKNANKVNHLAVGYLSEIAKEKDIKLIHISTDYVFDGKNYKPYIENDATNPNTIYGVTKLAGEKIMQKINPCNSIIIRTSWVYSTFGVNFVKTILNLAKKKNTLGVVFDQLGTPTYAKDLAKVILDILPNISNKKVEIYHYSNEGVLSWYDFAKEIIHITKIECRINPIETKDYKTLAMRPHYSLLNKAKIKKEFGMIIPYWKNSLNNCLKSLETKNR